MYENFDNVTVMNSRWEEAPGYGNYSFEIIPDAALGSNVAKITLTRIGGDCFT